MSQGSMDRGMGGGMGGGQWSGGGGWAGQQSNFGGQQGGFRAGGGYTGSPKVRRRRLGWSAIKLWWSAGWIPGWRWLHRLPKVGWWATTERGQRFHPRWWAEVLIE